MFSSVLRHCSPTATRHVNMFSVAPITRISAHDESILSITSDPQFTVIDVRAPSEFASDHIPGAINLPVLNEEQRVEVGTVYKGQPFHARRQGAAHVSRNIAEMLETYFQDKEPSTFRPLVYCWRGGQRSKALTHILSNVGFQVHFLEGGYKTYRHAVVQELQRLSAATNFLLLGGHTGAGKTKVLKTLNRAGQQFIDLEALAVHRGSLLGHTDGTQRINQPTQKMFESHVAQELSNVDPNQLVWLEAESNKIGNLHIPTALWSKMKQSPRVHLRVPMAERVRHTLATYQYWMAKENQIELVDEVLAKLAAQQGRAWGDRMRHLVEMKKWKELVERLLVDHYDVLYSANEERSGNMVGEVLLNTLKEEEIIHAFHCQTDQIHNACQKFHIHEAFPPLPTTPLHVPRSKPLECQCVHKTHGKCAAAVSDSNKISVQGRQSYQSPTSF